MSNHYIHILSQMDWFMRNQPWFTMASALRPRRQGGPMEFYGKNQGKTMGKPWENHVCIKKGGYH